MKRRLSVLLVLLSAICALAAPKTIVHGDWTLIPRDSYSMFSLAYKNQPVISYATFSVYKTNYQGVKFHLISAYKVSPDKTAVTWAKETPEGKATFTVKLHPSKVDFTLTAAVKETSPTELGFGISFNDFKNSAGYVFGKYDKTSFTYTDAPFLSRSLRKLVLSQPQQEFTLTNHTPDVFGFTLQDKRDNNNGNVRYISSFRPRPGKTFVSKVTLSVQTFSPQQTKQRELAYTKPCTRTRPITFDNPGFEKDFTGWNNPVNASIDPTVSHQGNKAAKLVVNDPMKDNVYITRRIPITPGALYRGTCFVKTKNVMPAKGKMASVGAGLIVEWSDKDGRWIDAGAYACNLFGTRDKWQQVICDNVKAPADAGHAEIFLALRGKGTAWFDDLTLTEVTVSAEKVSPLPGEVINTNTPCLTWNPLKGVGNYQVLISSTPAFQPQTTFTHAVKNATFLQLQKPLPPGTWYWKVEAVGAKDVQTWSFTHQVPVTKDCLPPVITFQAQRILRPETPLVIPVTDQRGEKPSLTLNIGDQSYQPIRIEKAGAVSENGAMASSFMATFLPPQGWPKGFSTLAITATDPAGNRTTKNAWLLNAPPPPNPVIIDRNGRYSTHGKPFFPLGIYEVKQPDMLELRNIGFDCVHTYTWEFSTDNEGCRSYLDDCWKANHLRAFVGFQRSAICAGELEVIAKKVGALADHPGLFCWYLFDEPEIPAQYVSPTLLTEIADLVRKLDPYHAVVMTTWGRGMNRYRRTWDTHWTQAYQKPDGVIRQLDEHRRHLLNQSPMTLLVHCYDQEQTTDYRVTGKFNAKNFKPDYDWLRCAAFAGITQNVNGLWWWWFARNSKTFVTAASIPEAWANVTKVIRELKSIQPFLDAVPTPNNNGRVKVKDNLVVWCVKETAAERLVIIANTGEQPIQVKLNLGHNLPEFDLKLGRYGVFHKTFAK